MKFKVPKGKINKDKKRIKNIITEYKKDHPEASDWQVLVYAFEKEYGPKGKQALLIALKQDNSLSKKMMQDLNSELEKPE
mgnify:CR=1 FL=1